MDYEFTHGKYGKKLIIRKVWSRKFIKIILQHNIRDLELLCPVPPGELIYLKEIDFIEAFKIIEFEINDISPIHFLHNLRELYIGTFCKTELNFQDFPHLEKVYLEWRPKAKSLFENSNLKEVCLSKYKADDLTTFNQLVNLTDLSVWNTNIKSIGDLSNLKSLAKLSIANARSLESLRGVEVFNNLIELDIEGCRKIKELEPIRNLRKLETIRLSQIGEVPTLKPLENMVNLNFFYFAGTVSDGKVAFIDKLPKLTQCFISKEAHYDKQIEEFRTCMEFVKNNLKYSKDKRIGHRKGQREA